MTAEVLAEAVRLGVDMEDVVERGKRKGMYGLGMKTACASIGRFWSITTRPAGEARELYIEFDLLGLQARGADIGDAWRHVIEEREAEGAGPLGDLESGTCVSIKRLRDKHPNPGPVLDGLGRAFHPHLRDGDKILVNGEPAGAPEFELIDGSRVEIDERFGPDDQYCVKGWAGLDRQTHNDGNYGINIYRQGQLIQAWDKSWFRAHLMTSRVVGEVHADFLPPSFHKKGINTQSPEWKAAESHMKEVLKPLATASGAASRNRNDPTREARAVQGLQDAMGTGDTVGSELGTEQPIAPSARSGDAQDATGKQAMPQTIEVDETTIYLPDGEIGLTHIVEALDDPALPWDFIFQPGEGGDGELQAVLNSDSRLFKTVKKAERFLGTLALADTVADFLVTRRGVAYADARKIRDKWLFAALGKEKIGG